ncbi:hypothetical protein [Streptomyces collinus]|uniref:hypothetical protein n=1 Tax=Streptomyces collinus TaxID=42684 RepID=UPI0036AC4773
MIEDWYFCSAMRDTPHGTHAYLAVLDVLDAPAELGEAVPDALDALEDCEPWTALHVAPRLLRLATGGGENAELCLEHLLGTVAHTVGGGKVAEALTDLLRACAQESPSRAGARLGHAATTWGDTAKPSATDEPFRELTHYPQETLLLAATAHLAEHPDAAESINSELGNEGSSLEELTRRALAHEYGRLPFLLALRALGDVASGPAERNRLLKALCRPAVGWVDLEPDLMTAAARLLHLGTGRDTEAAVADLDTDAVTLNGLRGLVRLRGDVRPRTPAARVLDRLGLPGEKPPPALSAVLWQQALWDLAARVHPVAAAAVLVDRWGAPGGRPHYPVWFSGPVEHRERIAWARQLTDLWQLRTGPVRPPQQKGGGAGHVIKTGHLDAPRLPSLASWAFSPWVDRALVGRDAAGGADRFPTVHDQVVLLRLLSSLRTAVRLLRHGGEQARFLADLVMHGTEVLTEGRLGQHMREIANGDEQHKDSPVPPALVPLAFSAFRTGMYALRGVYPELHPEVFAQRTVASTDPEALRDPTQRFYRQAQLLHRDGGALNVLVRAVLEALSGASGPQDRTPQSRWFDGEPAIVELVLDLAARRLHPWAHRQNLGNALLLQQLLLERQVTADRMAHNRDMDRRPQTFHEILLIAPSDLETSDDLETFDRWIDRARRTNGAAHLLAAASVRLLQAMKQPRDGLPDGALRALVDEWVSRMDRVRAPKEFARLTRWYMLQMFDVIQDDSEQDVRVMHKLLDVFTEFGLRTPTDQRLLFKRLVEPEPLAEPRPLPSGAATTVRTRLLSLSYDGRLAQAGVDRATQDVWERAMYRETGQSLGRQLDWLVRSLTRDASGDGRENRAFVERSWEKSVLSSDLRSQTVPLGTSERHLAGAARKGKAPDPRTVVAQFAYQSRDEAVFHHLPVDMKQGETYDLYNEPGQRDKVIREARQGRSPSVVGVVCGRTGEGRLLLNCGLGQPLEASADHSVEVGDPVRFQLGHDRYEGIEVYGVPQKLPVTHRVGDVRRVRVTLRPAKGMAGVVLADAPDDTEEGAGPLSAWDPDLTRGFAPADERPGNVVETVARYETDGWHPVDRGFTEFLASELPYGGGTVAVLTLMEQTAAEPGAWRFGLRPGHTYLLPDRCWDPESAAALREEIAEARDPVGLRCWVTVTDPPDKEPPRLTLVSEPPDDLPESECFEAAAGGLDTRNLRWRDLCSGDTVEVVLKDRRGWVEHGIPGFPVIVVKDMPPHSADSVEQTVTGWDERGMRTAQVKALVDPHLDAQQATTEAFHRLHDLRAGDVVRLRGGVKSPSRGGTYNAWTVEGNIQVAVEAESVMLRPARDADEWQRAVRGRDAVVTRVTWTDRDTPTLHPRDVAQPVSTDDLLAQLPEGTPAEVGKLLAGAHHLDGVLLSAPTSHSGQTPQVWLRVGEHVVDVRIPWEAFPEPARSSGDRVKACRTGGYWAFTVVRRRVFARCLWRLDETPGRNHAYLGTALDTSQKRFPLGQVHGQPGVLADLSKLRRRGQDEFTSAPVSLGTPFLDGGKRGRQQGRDAVSRHRAQVSLGRGRTAWGYTRARFETEQAWQVDSVELELTPRGRARFYDVRRIFKLTEARSGQTDGDQDKAWPLVMKAAGWNAELRDREAVLLPVPVDDSGRRVSLPPVPLEPDELPHVEGATYARKNARVVVRPVPAPAEGTVPYTASFRQVQPLRLGTFMEIHNIVAGRETETSLYFVGLVPRDRSRGGRPQPDRLLFEYGYGRTLQVHLNDVRLDGRPLRGARELPVFHGDQVTRVTITPKVRRGDEPKGQDRFWLDLHGHGIRWSTERRLRREAGLGILSRLTVRLDREADTAHVLGVETLSRAPATDERAGEGPEEVCTPRLRLTQKGMASVLSHYPTGPDVVRVLGRLDIERWDRTNGLEVQFRHVRPVVDPKAQDGIRHNEHVFMWAERIQQHRNDVTLDLALELGSEQAPERIVARVTRRTFAHREDLLRRIYEESRQKEDALTGTPYLVELRRWRQGDGHFEGRMTKAPARRAKALLSLLTTRDPSCFATVTADEPDHLRLELRAGIHVSLTPADIAESDDVEPGTVVRVTRTEDDRFRLRTALPSDSAYAVDGREAVVFPKNPLLSGNRPLAKQLKQPLFTVSGLPNTELFAAQAETEDATLAGIGRVMRHPHPKTGRLRTGSQDLVLEATEPGESKVAWLSVDPGTLEARLAPVIPGEPEQGPGERAKAPAHPGTPIDPAQLSFADRGARWIAERHAVARDVPHDGRTGHWPDGTPGSVVREELDRRGSEPPVIPADGPTLRFPLEQGRHYGFPAGHLTVRRAGADRRTGKGKAEAAGRRRTDEEAHLCPVAGPVRHAGGAGEADGLWLELSPGRLAEVPGGLVHTLRNGVLESLEGLCWDLFRPGDMVWATAHQRGLTEPACVVLRDWRPGLRGALGDAPAVLTVRTADPGSGTLHLGGGDRELRYPVTREAAVRHAEGSTVRLTPDNRLAPWSGAPEPGDAVLLGCDQDGVLHVHGVPGAAVALAEDGWADDDWLRRELSAPPERVLALLAMVDGALPVTVERAGADGTLLVSRAGQPRLPAGPERRWQVPARPAGRLADGRLVLSAGGALLAVPLDRLVPGLPAEAADAVAATLTGPERPGAGARTLWLHSGADGTPETGLRIRQEAERLVLPLAAVDGNGGDANPAGLLCQEKASGALRWLPAAHAAWANLTGGQLHEHLVEPERHVWAQVVARGHVSCTSSASALSHFRRLRIGQPVRLVVLGGVPRRAPHGRHRYLARLESNDLLVSFLSRASNLPDDQRLVGEVEALTDHTEGGAAQVRTVHRNQRGIVPDVPSIVVAANKPPARFDRYRDVCLDPDAVIEDEDGETTARQRLVRAAWHHLEAGGSGKPSAEAEQALDHWADLCMRERWEEKEADLLPLLAATLLTAAKGADNEDDAGLAVDLAYHLGARALRAVHVDPMLASWIAVEQHRTGLWGRLGSVTVTSLLEPADLERLVSFGRARLYRAAVEKEPELELIARGLLLSVGEPVHLDPLLDPPGIIAELSRIRRALVPPGNETRAQDGLHPAQIAFLASVFRAALRNARHAVLPGVLFTPPDWSDEAAGA